MSTAGVQRTPVPTVSVPGELCAANAAGRQYTGAIGPAVERVKDLLIRETVVGVFARFGS